MKNGIVIKDVCNSNIKNIEKMNELIYLRVRHVLTALSLKLSLYLWQH